MKKIIALLAFTVLVACSAREWKMTIIADIPTTDKHSIQWAILDFNPTEKFVKEFSGEYLSGALKAVKTDEEKDVQITSSIIMTWDTLFREVTADKLYQMNDKDTNYYGAAEGSGTPHPSNIWLTTKAFTISGKPFCYAVPFVISDGSNQTCRLDSTNLISLAEVYQKQIIKKH
jgi:hypothetical protein